MLDMIFNSLTEGTLTIEIFLLCIAVSLILGLGIALVYMYRNTYSKSFVATLVVLPAMVQIVIMLVNGNLGAGVAVMGAFGLVRFRSVPGTAKEISCIFFAMAVGLATGMGYVAFAVVFFIIIGLVTILLSKLRFGEPKGEERVLKITIPENLEYDGLFDDLFAKFTESAVLSQVKTTNMGSLYELQYHVYLKGKGIDKSFLDEIRCRNGNLTVSCGRVAASREEL